jgi:hypothetical protein
MGNGKCLPKGEKKYRDRTGTEAAGTVVSLDKVSAKSASLRAGEKGLGPPLTELAAAPLLYAMIVPLVILDLFATLYHHIVFPLLDIPLVPRQSYIKMDRHRLSYLTPLQRVACAYCGYANGLLQYATRMAGDTERYFCPIKHQPSSDRVLPPHHRRFIEYGDEAGWRRFRRCRGKGVREGREE